MSTVCVHGLGYIGLPTAAMLANYGHQVVGYDTKSDVVEQLRNGDIHIDEPGLRAFVTEARESGQLEVSQNIQAAEYHIICVPTPFNEQTKSADLTYVKSAGESVRSKLREGDTVILESTVPPGTTEKTLCPVLEESELRAGEDFALVHCPETVLPGNMITELKQNKRIIGGVNGVSAKAAVHLYESFVEGDILTTSDATTAEFVKLIQNTYRDTNIALANEIAKIAHDYDIDSREAIQLANSHPRVDILLPGPGVGGHCLPIDPWFLGQNSDRLDLISKARQINDGMTNYITDMIREDVGSLAGLKIAILGVAYKGNVGDTRMSPGLKLARHLQSDAGTESEKPPEIAIHDPHVNDSTLNLRSFEDAMTGADVTIIATDHDEFESIEPSHVSELVNTRVIIDSKGILETDVWSAEGFVLRQV